MEKENIIRFVRDIIESEFDSELETYDLFAGNIYDVIVQGGDLKEIYATKGGHYEFSMDAVEKIVTSLSVLAGTVLTSLNITEKLKKNKQKVADLRTCWEDELVKNGLSRKKALQIVEKFHADLQKIL